MLKRLTLALLLAAGTTAPTLAQTTPGTTASQPKQFCRLIIITRVNGTVNNVTLYYGQESKLTPVADPGLAAEAEKVKSIDSEPLILNYLSSRGWEVVGYNSLNAFYSTYVLQRPAK